MSYAWIGLFPTFLKISIKLRESDTMPYFWTDDEQIHIKIRFDNGNRYLSHVFAISNFSFDSFFLLHVFAPLVFNFFLFFFQMDGPQTIWFMNGKVAVLSNLRVIFLCQEASKWTALTTKTVTSKLQQVRLRSYPYMTSDGRWEGSDKSFDILSGAMSKHLIRGWGLGQKRAKIIFLHIWKSLRETFFWK